MGFLKTVVTNRLRFDEMVVNATLQADTQYIIVDENVTFDTRFKGVFYGVTYEDCIDALRDVVGVVGGTAGDYAFANPPGLPPKFIIWDGNDTTPDWKVSTNLAPIQVDNTGKNVVLTLVGNTLSAQYEDAPLFALATDLDEKVDGYINGQLKIVRCLQYQYDLLETKDFSTLYVIMDVTNKAYVGPHLLWDADYLIDNFVYYSTLNMKTCERAERHNLAEDPTIPSASYFWGLSNVFLDIANNKAHWVGKDTTNIRTTTLDTLTLIADSPTGWGYATYGSAEDTDYIYLVSSDNKLRKVSKTTRDIVLDVDTGSGSPNSVVVDSLYVYVAKGLGASGTVKKYAKSDLSYVGEVITGFTNQKIVSDDTHLYVGTVGTDQARVKKYTKDTLTFVSETPIYGNRIDALAIKDGFIYAGGTGFSSALTPIRKYDTATMSLIGETDKLFNASDIKVDDTFIYAVGGFTVPAYTIFSFNKDTMLFHTYGLPQTSPINFLALA